MEGKTWQEKLRKCIARFFGKKETPAEDKAQEGPSSDAPAVVKTDTPASALEIEARVSEETGVPSQVEDVKMSTEDAAAPRQGESAGARAEETKPDAGSDGEDKQQTEVIPFQRKWTNSFSKIFKKSVPPAADQAQEGKKSDVPADVAPVVDSGTSEKEVLPEETDKPSKVECAKACTEETAASGQVDNAGACIVETAKPVLEARSCPADSSLDKQPMAEVHPSAHEESEASAGLEHPRGRTFSLFKRSSH